MRVRLTLAAVGAALLAPAFAQQAQAQHLNPVVDAIIQNKIIVGIAMPTAGRGGGGGRRGAPVDSTQPPPPPPAVKTPLDLAKDALAVSLGLNGSAGYLFSGSPERNTSEQAMAPIAQLAEALGQSGALKKVGASTVLTHPIGTKAPVMTDSAKVITDFSAVLNAGVTTINVSHLATVQQARWAIAAMRFKAKGGTRPDNVGTAPKAWGLTEAQYKEKADVWPLNPNGELLFLPIVESKEGVENIRAIAAEKGVAGIVIGAGTMRGVYSGDQPAFDAAVAKILAACKEFNKPCGYPEERDIRGRVKQGFNIIIIQTWGPGGQTALDSAKKVAGGI